MAAPQGKVATPYQEVTLLRELQHNNIGTDSGYEFAYEQSDGQKRQERAELIAPRSVDEEPILRVQGSYSYYNPYDGQTYIVEYTADENGFHPRGAHLPH